MHVNRRTRKPSLEGLKRYHRCVGRSLHLPVKKDLYELKAAADNLPGGTKLQFATAYVDFLGTQGRHGHFWFRPAEGSPNGAVIKLKLSDLPKLAALGETVPLAKELAGLTSPEVPDGLIADPQQQGWNWLAGVWFDVNQVDPQYVSDHRRFKECALPQMIYGSQAQLVGKCLHEGKVHLLFRYRVPQDRASEVGSALDAEMVARVPLEDLDVVLDHGYSYQRFAGIFRAYARDWTAPQILCAPRTVPTVPGELTRPLVQWRDEVLESAGFLLRERSETPADRTHWMLSSNHALLQAQVQLAALTQKAQSPAALEAALTDVVQIPSVHPASRFHLEAVTAVDGFEELKDAHGLHAVADLYGQAAAHAKDVDAPRAVEVFQAIEDALRLRADALPVPRPWEDLAARTRIGPEQLVRAFESVGRRDFWVSDGTPRPLFTVAAAPPEADHREGCVVSLPAGTLHPYGRAEREKGPVLLCRFEPLVDGRPWAARLQGLCVEVTDSDLERLVRRPGDGHQGPLRAALRDPLFGAARGTPADENF